VRHRKLDASQVKRIFGSRRRRDRLPVGSIEFLELVYGIIGDDIDPVHLEVGDRLCARARARSA